MGKVIPFPSKQRADDEARRLLAIANEIDDVILRHLETGSIDPQDLAGLLAHRLGTLMRHLDQKGRLVDICQQVIRTQAAVE